MKIIKVLTVMMMLLSSYMYAKDFVLNVQDQTNKDPIKVSIPLEIDDKGKIIPFQRLNVPNVGDIKNLKIITAPGLKGTMIDEREIVVFYKTSLDVAGMNIRNVYKVGVGRLYYDESVLTINLDNDYYQNINSFLSYHNIKSKYVKDLDNTYGTWVEIL